MKRIKCKGKLFRIMIVIGLFVMTFQTNPIQAFNVNDSKSIIHNLSITDNEGHPLDNAVTQWDKFRINADFNVPNNLFSEGDTVSIKLPNKLKFSNLKEFALTNAEGSIVANVTANPTTKELVLKFTKFVEENSDISGSFFFYTQVDFDVVTGPELIPIEVEIDGVPVFIGELPYEPALPSGSELDKSGWFNDANNKLVTYEVDINRSGKVLNDVVITDKINTYGVTIVPESLKIEKGNWRINASGTNWELANIVNVTDEHAINYSSNYDGFTVNLGDINSDEGYAIRYDVVIDYELVDGEKIRNTATMTSNEEVITSKEVEVIYLVGGGSGQGDVYNIKLLKVNSSNDPLENAYFKLVRVRNNHEIGVYKTDVNGQIIISELLKDDYVISEVQAPDGYILDETPIKISSDDFDDSNTAYIQAINSKKPAIPIGITVNKVLIGSQLKEEQFAFELRSSTDQVLQTVKNDKDGLVNFDLGEFSEVGKFKFTINELNDKQECISYDNHLIEFTVEVIEESDGYKVTVITSGDLTFTNTFNEPEKPEPEKPEPEKPEPEKPEPEKPEPAKPQPGKPVIEKEVVESPKTGLVMDNSRLVISLSASVISAYVAYRIIVKKNKLQ